ncbi:MAG: hypothetical protein ACFE0Q_21435 [Anaerolineae bacterium]
MIDKRTEISQKIKAVLTDVVSSVGDITDVGVYDVHHQLRISIESTVGFDFWDDDDFDKLEQIIVNSPKTPVDFIHFKLERFYCIVRPIRHGTYWIFIFQKIFKPGGFIQPFSQWEQQILDLIHQIDDTGALLLKDLQNGFDPLLKSLTGDTIIGVSYYLYPNTIYNHHQEPFHHISDGVDLEMRSGRVIGISWDRQFVNFNLSVIDKSLEYHLLTPTIARVNMTHHPSWHPIIEKTIQQVEMYGGWVVTTPSQESDVTSEDTRQYYPQDMKIVLDNGSHLYISASMYLLECDCFLRAMDNLSIFFDEDTAKRYLPSFIDDDQSET